MDLMAIRRGLMAQMGSGLLIWKTVTLAENHETGSTDNQKGWFASLGISEQTDFHQYAYVCIFDNNQSSQINYIANVICYYDATHCSFIRSFWEARGSISTESSANDYYLFASAGTRITVVKIKK